MRLWVSAGGAVSPLHYDAAGSFLAQAIILTMAICFLTTQATILTWPYAHRGSDLAQLPQRPCSLVITP